MLLAGVSLDRAVIGLSGGERRRCALAALLLGDHDLIVLDEPTNHLDVEAVAWLAEHLVSRPSRAGRRHPRPLVPRRGLPVDVGGARRRASTPTRAGTPRSCSPRPSGSARPRPRRHAARTSPARSSPGCAAVPPARTSKPKFRIDAANALIDDVPPPRDRLELQRFATQRLGKDVIDIEDVDLARGEQALLDARHLAARPRATGSASSASTAPARRSVLALLAGDPAARRRPRQARSHRRAPAPHPGTSTTSTPRARVLPTVESIRRVTRTADGQDVSATLDAGALRLHRRPAHRAARRPVRRRAAALPAAPAAADRAQRAAPRRAHQRPRHRHPQRARGLPRRLARHPGRGLPRPLLPRAGHRLGLGAARRRPGLDAPARGGRVPRAPAQRPHAALQASHDSATASPPTVGASRPKRAGPAARRSARPARRSPGSRSSSQRIAEREAELNAEMADEPRRLRAAGRARPS